jgi:hypothetical protein
MKKILRGVLHLEIFQKKVLMAHLLFLDSLKKKLLMVNGFKEMYLYSQIKES